MAYLLNVSAKTLYFILNIKFLHDLSEIISIIFLLYFLDYKFIILKFTYVKQVFLFINTTGFGINLS